MSYQKLHPIQQLNFQINRILTYGSLACDQAEVEKAAKKISDIPTWNQVWKNLGSIAEKEKRHLHAAYYYRLAEFFLKECAEKEDMFRKSLYNYHLVISEDKEVSIEYVPYQNSKMKVMKFSCDMPKGTIVMFGGYDSFIEEFYLAVKDISKFQYDVYLFEGPGQGETLRNGLTFEPKWEKPVSAILDYYNLSNVCIIGISWGGYFSLRAAAFEPRISKAVAYDILYDGIDFMMNPLPSLPKLIMPILLNIKAKKTMNRIINRIKSGRILLDWAITHGQYITGTDTPYDFYCHMKEHSLKGIMEKVRCDVLLLAGEKDHYIPLSHFEILMNGLTKARSLKGRVFTVEEGGAEHCQIGAHHLAINEIITWLESFADGK